MDEENRSQFVDDLLDASLSRYSSVTPRPGLEGRVLANARAAQERRARFIWAGWLAVGAAAVMITVGVLNFTHRQATPTTPKSAEVVKTLHMIVPGPHTVAPERVRTSPPTSKRRTSKPNLASASEESRLPVFPSPSPMTEEEKLLAQYVRTTPAEALSAPASESNDIQELNIEEIAITPLDAEQDETQPK
jgi:hypothetical protein